MKSIAAGLEVGGFAAGAQGGGGSVGVRFGVVVGQRVVAATAALHHQGAIGVVRVKEVRHGTPRELLVPAPLQGAGQLSAFAVPNRAVSVFCTPLCHAV